jgi:hypothetical protein
MDCPYKSENRLVRLPRNQIGTNEPLVETLHTVSSPVYFTETLKIDGEYHVVFSTAIEPATAPEHTARVVHGSTVDDFKSWRTLVEYGKSSQPLNNVVDTNAYVFLATHKNNGLYLNPYNTDADDGNIRNIPISCFAAIGD